MMWEYSNGGFKYIIDFFFFEKKYIIEFFVCVLISITVYLKKKKKDSIIYLNPPLEYSHITFYLNFRINSSIYEYKHNKCLLITTTIINFIFKTKILNILFKFLMHCTNYWLVILVFKKITFISHSFKGTAWQQNPNIFFFFLQIKKYKGKKKMPWDCNMIC